MVEILTIILAFFIWWFGLSLVLHSAMPRVGPKITGACTTFFKTALTLSWHNGLKRHYHRRGVIFAAFHALLVLTALAWWAAYAGMLSYRYAFYCFILAVLAKIGFNRWLELKKTRTTLPYRRRR